MKNHLIKEVQELISPEKIYIVNRDGKLKMKGEEITQARFKELAKKFQVTVINVNYK